MKKIISVTLDEMITKGRRRIDAYTETNSKVGFCRRRTATEFEPACIAKLSKFSCFGAAKAGSNSGRLLGIFPTFEFISVYMRTVFILFFLLFSTLIGKEVTPPPKPEKHALPPLRAILLVGSAKCLKVSGLEKMEGLVVENLEVPGSTENLSALFADEWGKPITKEMVQRIRDELLLYYRSYGRASVQVQLPSQATGSGVLQFVITCIGMSTH